MSQDRRKCVLIVEDDPVISACLAELLQTEGYRVVVAKDGQQGLDMLRQSTLPNLILLDLMMPIKDGAAFRTEQIAHPQWRAIPTLVLSADVHGQNNGHLFDSCAYVTKPLDINRLLSAVERRCE